MKVKHHAHISSSYFTMQFVRSLMKMVRNIFDLLIHCCTYTCNLNVSNKSAVGPSLALMFTFSVIINLIRVSFISCHLHPHLFCS